MALTDKLKAIADAIRGKTGKTEGLTLDQMPAEIAGIETGDGEYEFCTEWGFQFNPVMVAPATMTRIPVQGAFSPSAGVKDLIVDNLTSIEFPNVTSITGNNTFQNAKKLECVKFPKLSGKVGQYSMFFGCSGLKELQFGSIGYAVTEVAYSHTLFGSGVYTFYVADDATLPLTNVPGDATNATIIYRSATTGEVIEL